VPGNPASHPVTGSPPSGMKAPTRLPKTSARREPTCPDGPACEANRALCERRAGESCRAPDPRPKNPRSPGTSRCIPCATPDSLQLGKVSGGVLGSFRYAPLWANRLCRAQTPIAPQPTCQRLPKKALRGRARLGDSRTAANSRRPCAPARAGEAIRGQEGPRADTKPGALYGPNRGRWQPRSPWSSAVTGGKIKHNAAR